jgi:hypothetical protein
MTSECTGARQRSLVDTSEEVLMLGDVLPTGRVHERVLEKRPWLVLLLRRRGSASDEAFADRGSLGRMRETRIPNAGSGIPSSGGAGRSPVGPESTQRMEIAHLVTLEKGAVISSTGRPR